MTHLRSLMNYHCTALKVAGVINDEFISKLEITGFWKILHISNYIDNKIICKWSQQYRILFSINNQADRVRKQMLKMGNDNEMN
jgi:hypothetical protein